MRTTTNVKNLIAAFFVPLLVACGGGGGSQEAAAPAPVRITGISEARITTNGDVSQPLALRVDPFSHPRLAQLRTQENLDVLRAQSAGETEFFLKLKDWVASQWDHSTPDPTPPWDAVTILDWIRTGKTGGFCGQYAQVLLQALTAYGYPARYVEIGLASNPYAHFVVEVWSNEHDKWIVLDADYNVHFEKYGVPLSARDVHDHYVWRNHEPIDVVLGADRDGHPNPFSYGHSMTELYYYLRFGDKANHLAAPDEPVFDRMNDFVEYLDARTVPWERSRFDSPYPKERLTARTTTDPRVIDARINQVELTISAQSREQVDLSLRHNAVQFSHYEYRGGDAGPWSSLHGHTLQWRPGLGADSLHVRTVNAAGVAGPASTIELSWN